MLRIASLALALLAWPAASLAAEQRTLEYWHLYADAQGASHFKKEFLVFKAGSSPDLAEPPHAADLPGAQGATFLLLAGGQVENWHRAPRTQFLIVVQGASQVTAGDGTVKEFHVGDVVLMDDTTGKGHITKGLGTTDHIALVIPVSREGLTPAP